MLANEPTRSYIGPTRGRAQVYLRSTPVHRSSNHNTKSQKNLVVVIHPYDRTRPTNTNTIFFQILDHQCVSIGIFGCLVATETFHSLWKVSMVDFVALWYSYRPAERGQRFEAQLQVRSSVNYYQELLS